MSPSAHILASWLTAFPFHFAHRERRIISIAGVSPDIDGIGWLVDRAASLAGLETDYYSQYHHVIAHNVMAALVISVVASAIARTRRRLVFVLSFLVVHLHFLFDVLGSRGPDGYQWPIVYLYPFSAQYEWVWSGQWELSAWPNIAIALSMLIVAAYLGWRRRYSFVEVISAKLDRAFFEMLARYGYA